jgi:rhodanese-related sulfurtransferase
MKKTSTICTVIVLMASLFLIATTSVNAADLTRITADDAFDAVVEGKDPISGETGLHVVLVDCRTPEEYYWVGTCGKVTRIDTEAGFSFVPDNYKVKLVLGGRLLEFELFGKRQHLPVRRIFGIETEPIAVNIPYKIFDYSDCSNQTNPTFCSSIHDLAPEYDVIIFMCRSGKRSEGEEWPPECGELNGAALYEIDRADKNGRGGFEGTSYDDVYNGYRGFPGRATRFQEHESVSWKDAGLPIHIGWCPE